MKDLLIAGLVIAILLLLGDAVLRWCKLRRVQAAAYRAIARQEFKVIRASIVTGGIKQEHVCTVKGEKAAIDTVQRCKREDKDNSFYYIPYAQKWTPFVRG